MFTQQRRANDTTIACTIEELFVPIS